MGKGPEQTLLQRGHTEHPETHEGMLDITSHQRDANKTTIRYYFTPVRMVIINKSTNNKCWQGCGEKGTLVQCWWECKLVQPVWKTVWDFLKKLKMELPFDPAIPLLGLYPKNPETLIQKNLCAPIFIAAQFTIAKCWKQPKCPSVNKWIKTAWYIYIMEFYTAERKELLTFATQ